MKFYGLKMRCKDNTLYLYFSTLIGQDFDFLK